MSELEKYLYWLDREFPGLVRSRFGMSLFRCVHFVEYELRGEVYDKLPDGLKDRIIELVKREGGKMRRSFGIIEIDIEVEKEESKVPAV